MAGGPSTPVRGARGKTAVSVTGVTAPVVTLKKSTASSVPKSQRIPCMIKVQEWYVMVNTMDTLHEFLSIIDQVEDNKVDIFFDAEGGNGHGRGFDLNAVSIHMLSKSRVWVLDPKVLGTALVETPSPAGRKRTLGQILADPVIPVVVFDVRADSDSMYHNINVHMRGVIDLAVMEMAVRDSRPVYRHSLAKCIQGLPESRLPAEERALWEKRKRDGKAATSGPNGYGVFGQRPMPRKLQEYAANDVMLLNHLYTYYMEDTNLAGKPELLKLVMKLSLDMTEISIQPNYQGNSEDASHGLQDILALWEWDEDDADPLYVHRLCDF